MAERGRFTEAEIERVALHVGARRYGTRWKGLCPFHAERTPSFIVDERGGKCFGCGWHGSLLDVLVKTEVAIDWRSALLWLRPNAHFRPRPSRPRPLTLYAPSSDVAAAVENHLRFLGYSDETHAEKTARVNELRKALSPFMPRQQFTHMLEDLGVEGEPTLAYRSEPPPWQQPTGPAEDPDAAALARHAHAMYFGSPAERYALQRGITDEVALRFMLGFGQEDEQFGRLSFPIRNRHERPVGVAGRSLGREMPKYRNSRMRKSAVPYGISEALDHGYALAAPILLCEGYADVWALWREEVRAVAVMGTACSADQAAYLRPYGRVVLAFDGDDAGKAGALRAFPTLLQAGLWPYSLPLNGHKDPDALCRAEGRTGVLRRVGEAKPLFGTWMDQANERQLHDLLAGLTDPSVFRLVVAEAEKRGAHIEVIESATIGGLRLLNGPNGDGTT